jgi:hypothetical protein
MPDTPLPARPRPASGSHAPTAEQRERAAVFLSERFAADALTLDQFEERVALVYRVATRAELDAIVADLGGAQALPAPPARVAVADTVPRHGRRFAVLSNLEQHDIAVVPRLLDVSALLGNVELDLSTATFGAGETAIDVSAVFGHITIKLPGTALVEQRAGAYLGSIECQPSPVSTARRTGPKIVINGSAIFGAVEIIFAAVADRAGAARNRLDSPGRHS